MSEVKRPEDLEIVAKIAFPGSPEGELARYALELERRLDICIDNSTDHEMKWRYMEEQKLELERRIERAVELWDSKPWQNGTNDLDIRFKQVQTAAKMLRILRGEE